MPTIQPSSCGCCAVRAAVRDVVLAGLDGERADLEVQPLGAGFGRLVHRRERRDVFGVRRHRGRRGGRGFAASAPRNATPSHRRLRRRSTSEGPDRSQRRRAGMAGNLATLGPGRQGGRPCQHSADDSASGGGILGMRKVCKTECWLPQSLLTVGIMAAPAGSADNAASKPVCKTLNGTRHRSRPRCRSSRSSTKVKPTITIKGASLGGCSGRWHRERHR